MAQYIDEWIDRGILLGNELMDAHPGETVSQLVERVIEKKCVDERLPTDEGILANFMSALTNALNLSRWIEVEAAVIAIKKTRGSLLARYFGFFKPTREDIKKWITSTTEKKQQRCGKSPENVSANSIYEVCQAYARRLSECYDVLTAMGDL